MTFYLFNISWSFVGTYPPPVQIVHCSHPPTLQSSKRPGRMAPTLASALTLSSLGWFSKAFLNFACKDVRVQGLEHLLHALREPLAPKALDKGKGRQVDWSNDPEATSRLIEGRTRRRGVITSMYSVINKQSSYRSPCSFSIDSCFPSRSMQPHIGCGRPTCKILPQRALGPDDDGFHSALPRCGESCHPRLGCHLLRQPIRRGIRGGR